MRDRVHLASEDGNGWQTLFWVGDDGALRVTSGFGGEIHAGAYDLDAELATREPIAIPQVMPAADCAPPEFHTCIDRSGDPRWIAGTPPQGARRFFAFRRRASNLRPQRP